MTPEEWQQIKEKLHSALELEPSDRSAFITTLAGNDPQLRQELESLLAAQQKIQTDFLSAPVYPDLRDQSEATSESLIGKRLGQYEIVAEIGQGGMGEVYRAIRADDQFRKEVAVKLIRAGRESAFVVARFKNERQILASLEHPNIARLLDGGTTSDGVPYFVMELIQGQSILEYCNRHALDIRARLELFLQVCSAVQFAHQRLIIHRDIKPGNILVTEQGAPKLLDFGIAKVLDPSDTASSQATVTVVRILTPEYASPEQVTGEPITTATDVYSLGVVLYELLTGERPYAVSSRTPEAVAEAIREFEPRKPSSLVARTTHTSTAATEKQIPEEPHVSKAKLARQLRGDLDNIVLMALRKEPTRRYASVEQFSEDIRRHLDNLPVIARKVTARYRASKFVTRHKTGVALAAVASLLLITALLITLREAQIARQQARIAQAERARAERRFNDVRKLANSLMFEIHDSIRDLPGATDARKILVTRALEYLDNLSKEASGDPSLQRELAAAYDRVGDVLGSSTGANLGQFDEAAKSYAKAMAIREALVKSTPGNVDMEIELADEYFRAALLSQDIGDLKGSLDILQRAGPYLQSISAGQNDPKLLDRIAGIYYYTGTALEKRGDFIAALLNYRKGLAIREPIATGSGAYPMPRTHLVADYLGIARMLARTGHADEGVSAGAKGLAIIKQLSAANPKSATLKEYVAEGYNICGMLASKTGDWGQALSNHAQANHIFKDLMTVDPNNQLATENFVFSDLAVAEAYVHQGKMTTGLNRMREAVAVMEARKANTLWDVTALGESYSDLGDTYAAMAAVSPSKGEAMRNWQAARGWYQRSVDIWSNQAKGPAFVNARIQISDSQAQLAKCETEMKKLNASSRAAILRSKN